jgi:hypothetical protein
MIVQVALEARVATAECVAEVAQSASAMSAMELSSGAEVAVHSKVQLEAVEAELERTQQERDAAIVKLAIAMALQPAADTLAPDQRQVFEPDQRQASEPIQREVSEPDQCQVSEPDGVEHYWSQQAKSQLQFLKAELEQARHSPTFLISENNMIRYYTRILLLCI